MSKKEVLAKQKQARINKILDDAKEALEAEEVKYFVCAVDKDPKAKDGGKVFVNMDITGDEFIIVLDVAMPTTQDITNLGIHVGQLIGARLKGPQTLKGNENRATKKKYSN